MNTKPQESSTIPSEIKHKIEFELITGERRSGEYTMVELATRLMGYWDNPKVRNWRLSEPHA